MKRALLVFVAVFMLACWLLQPGPAFAQDATITLTAEVGFDGYYKQNRWTPVRATLANSGPDVEGVLVVEQTGSSSSDIIRYQTPVTLPGQSRKIVTLCVGTDKYQASLTVRFVSDDEVLAQSRVRVTHLGEEEHLYAVISGESVDMAVLEQVAPPGESSHVAYIGLDELPAIGPAWGALDLLVLNNVDTAALSPAQREALTGWLGAGGHLVVTGGPNWRQTAAGLGGLLPVSISGSVSAYDLSALSELAATPIREGPFVVAQATVTAGQVLLAQDDLPLLARRDEGLGTVDWLGLDLALAPLRDWAGNERLWRTVLGAADSRPMWAHENTNTWAAREGLRSIPSLTLPSALQMVLFLLAYTLLVGPINYLVLRRLRRTELAWYTIPGLVLLFSGLAYLTGFQLKGGEVVLHRLSLVYSGAEAETARVRGLLGIFSPHRATYDVIFPGTVLARPLLDDMYGSGLGAGNSAVIEQGNQTVLRDLQLDVAGLRAFQVQLDIPAPTIYADLAMDSARSPRLTGQVTNATGIALQDTGLIIGETVVELGDLAPGQTATVSERLTSGRASAGGSSSSGMMVGAYYGYIPPAPGYVPIDKMVGGTDYWNDRDLNRRYQTLQAFLVTPETSGASFHSITFFGWSDHSLWNIEVADQASKTLDTVGYLVELPFTLVTGGEGVVIPPGLTTWRLLDSHRPGEAGPYELYLPTGWTSFEFQPWEAFQTIGVDTLLLDLDTNSSQPPIRVALWDWASDNWVVDETLGEGTNQIAQPDRFVGPSNAVRVRLENIASGSINVTRLDVTYQGRPE